MTSFRNAFINKDVDSYVKFSPSAVDKIIKRERMAVCEMTVKRTRLCYAIARMAKPRVQSGNTTMDKIMWWFEGIKQSGIGSIMGFPTPGRKLWKTIQQLNITYI